jgi:SAM-dependent methyltransferase
MTAAGPAAAVAAAYDALAPGYDRAVAEDSWMRAVLHWRYARLFAPGDRVLDAGAGTGLDSLALAARGVRVTAVDVSAGMLAELAAGAAERGLAGRVAIHRADLSDLSALPAAGFDGAVSAFAALNAVADPGRATAELARRLRPGARLVVHLLAPAGIWPRLGLAARGRIGEAAALAGRRERTVTLAGRPLRHRLWTAGGAYRELFAGRFHLLRAYSLGWLWPQTAGRLLPLSVAARLGRLEPWLGARRPLLGWGRFAVLELERRADSPGRDGALGECDGLGERGAQGVRP